MGLGDQADCVRPEQRGYLITKLTEEDGFGLDVVIERLQTTGHMNEPISETGGYCSIEDPAWWQPRASVVCVNARIYRTPGAGGDRQAEV
jgi:hypothetical protein